MRTTGGGREGAGTSGQPGSQAVLPRLAGAGLSSVGVLGPGG